MDVDQPQLPMEVLQRIADHADRYIAHQLQMASRETHATIRAPKYPTEMQLSLYRDLLRHEENIPLGMLSTYKLSMSRPWETHVSEGVSRPYATPELYFPQSTTTGLTNRHEIHEVFVNVARAMGKDIRFSNANEFGGQYVFLAYPSIMRQVTNWPNPGKYD